MIRSMISQSGSGVGVGVGAAVGVGVGAGVGAAVGAAVRFGVGLGFGLADGWGVGSDVGSGLDVAAGAGVRVGVGLAVGSGVAVESGARVGVAIGRSVGGGATPGGWAVTPGVGTAAGSIAEPACTPVVARGVGESSPDEGEPVGSSDEVGAVGTAPVVDWPGVSPGCALSPGAATTTRDQPDPEGSGSMARNARATTRATDSPNRAPITVWRVIESNDRMWHLLHSPN